MRPSEATRGGGGECTVWSQTSPLHQDHTDPPLVPQPILDPVDTSPTFLKSCALPRPVHAPTDNCVGPPCPASPAPCRFPKHQTLPLGTHPSHAWPFSSLYIPLAEVPPRTWSKGAEGRHAHPRLLTPARKWEGLEVWVETRASGESGD